MQFKTFLTGAMASGLLLSACTTDVIPLPDEELYARQFVKDFGLTDPTHDYNMAQQSGIKVITASSTDLKVYAKVNGKSYLFADATGISGTTEIPLTLPKDVDEVCVKAGSRRFTVKLDATLDLRNVSRTIHPSADGDFVSVEAANHDREFSQAQALRYREMLPEDGDQDPKNPNRFKKEVTTDFMFISDGKPFTIYPLYWQTSNTNTIGVYYYVNGEEVLVPVYTQKSGDELQRSETETKELNAENFQWDIWMNSFDQHSLFKEKINKSKFTDFTDEDWETMKEIVRDTYKSIEGMSSATISFYDIKEGSIKIKAIKEPHWESIGTVNCTLPDDFSEAGNENKYKFKSSGIKVTIPAGIEFGIYLKNSSNTFYSEIEKNEPSQGKEGFPATHMAHVCTHVTTDLKTGETFFRLGFEDWPGDESCDLNDMIFRIYDLAPNTIEDFEKEEGNDDEYEWIIAAEDLGGSYDWDFNDIVFSVKTLTVVEGESTKTKVTVEPLAAGGTMPVYIMFDGTIDGKEGCYHIGTELHSWFGNASNKVTNATAGQASEQVQKTLTFNVDGKWSLNSHENDGKWSSATRNMGGFWILVDPKVTLKGNSGTDPKVIETTEKFEDPNIHKVMAPEHDVTLKAPQMFCLTSDWEWPEEGAGIHVVYDQFEKWLADKNHKWFGEGVTHQSHRTVKRKPSN